MDAVKPVPAPNIGGLVRNFTKALRFHGGSGIAPEDKVRKKFKDNDDHGEKARKRASMEALLARLFASISSVKAAYSQLQISQSPYDADGIQKADELLVSELKNLSELKQIYLKKQIDPSPQVTQLLAEIQEQQSLLKTYEIMGRKFESQIKLKDSDISSMRERLDENDRQNRFLEKRLKQSGSLLHLDDLHISGLNPNHFITVLKHVVKSIQSFVKVMINQMKLSGWDITGAGNSIQPGVIYSKPSHVCFAFESFVCREMFDGFQCPDFSVPSESRSKHKRKQRQHFFNEFMDLKSISSREFLTRNPKSQFGKFCKFKYLQLIHPKMEISFFGNLIQRNNVNSGGYPDTEFFTYFSEMAFRVWYLHCLAFSFDPEASIFEMRKGCRFSEVYMESVVEDAFYTSNGTLIVDPRVGFTVVLGFKIGKTVIQSQVYPSPG